MGIAQDSLYPKSAIIRMSVSRVSGLHVDDKTPKSAGSAPFEKAIGESRYTAKDLVEIRRGGQAVGGAKRLDPVFVHQQRDSPACQFPYAAIEAKGVEDAAQRIRQARGDSNGKLGRGGMCGMHSQIAIRTRPA
jgi:hypothetical protein